MKSTNQIATAALAAALCLAPAAVFAQASGTSSQGTIPPSSSTPQTGQQQPDTTQPGATQPDTTQQPGTTQPSTTQPAGTAGTQSNQEDARQQLSAARTALAELTKLPQASQLQGEQRTQVVNFISAFNTFATATTDWRSKYDTVDKQLDDLLSSAESGAPAPPPAATPAPNGTGTPPAGDAAASGALDPAIVAKLREVREHLDAFELASGDPTFVADAIEKILNEASAGGNAGTVGTTGAGAGGSVTLTGEQVQRIRQQLNALREAVTK